MPLFRSQLCSHLLRSLLLGGLVVGAAHSAEPNAVGIEFFEKQVRPILVQHCYECHGEQKQNGGLRLDLRAGWSSGGDSGPAIVPGKPEESLVIQAIRYGGDYEMPPKGKLPAEMIKALEQWVTLGAPDPRVDEATVQTKRSTGMDLETGRQHWSYRPVRSSRAPAVPDASWPRGELDRWILARLESEQLHPAPDADRAALARRVYFDLLGLPPTPEEIDAFVQDSASDAYVKLVEQLLSSPRFGERWGRHWLDLARFGESVTLRGLVFKEAWRYRDYVIEAWNRDQPYDQFLREQIAGDLLPAATPADRARQLVATTYLALGNHNLEEQDKQQLELDVIDEQLDVIGKGILAQTLTCARCHDHKFDPIPQRDYYALAGILRNTQSLEHENVSKWVEAPLPAEPEQARLYQQHVAAVEKLKERLAAAKNAVKLTSTNKPDAPAAPLVLAPTELPGIVVDDSQAKRVGTWQESRFTKRYVGDGYLHDMNQDQGQKTLSFVPELVRDGIYEVRFAYSPAAGRATAVKVTVFSAEGEKTIPVDETDPPPIDGRFVSLGQFRFERAGQSFVIVSNEQADGHVTADAVQFLAAEMLADGTTAGPKPNPQESLASAELTSAEQELKKLEAEMKKLVAAAPYRPMAMTLLERSEIHDSPIYIRGMVHNAGEVVPRGFLQVCSTGPAAVLPATQSGRVELADWLASRQNPLTARVLVNRIWHALFGAAIVRTVDNFGFTGESPSHPELLDYLAERLMDANWSAKEIVREIVLSHAYCQMAGRAEADRERAAIVDPENRLLAGVNRRRLDAESFRDAILSVSGQLRLQMGGPTFDTKLAADYGFQHAGTRRSVYEPVFRNSLPEFFEAFDFADPSLVTGRRSTSTVAPQALFLMNHPFVLEQAQYTAQRLLEETAVDPSKSIDILFRRTLGRLPSSREREAVSTYLTSAGVGADSETQRKEWTLVSQMLFATIDFRYVE